MPKTPKEQLALAQQYSKEADTLSEQVKYKEALVILEKANTLTLPDGEAADIVRGNIWYAMSNCYSAKHDYTTALSFNQQAVDIRTKVFGELGEATLEANVSRGWIWSQIGQYHKALNHFYKILEKCAASPPTNSKQYGILYLQIGECHRMSQDFWQAILYYQKSLAVFQRLEKPNKYYESQCYECIGMAYAQAEETQEALHYLQKALDGFVSIKYPHKIAHIYISMGGIHHRLNNHQQTIYFYQKSLEVLKTLERTWHYDFATTYLGLGRAYSKLKNFEESHQYLQKALETHIRIHGFQHYRVAHTYYTIGSVYRMAESYLLAIKTLQQGLKACVFTFKEENIYKNPSLKNLQNVEKHVCILLLATKADVFRRYYLNVDADVKNIQAALECADLAIQAMEQMRESYHSDHSKLTTEATNSMAYQMALETAHTAWKKLETQETLEKGFEFAEKAKAILLLSAMQGEIAKVKSPIPDALLQQEQNLKNHLIQLDKDIQAQKTTQKDSETKEKAIQSIQVEFLDYHQQYSQLMQELEEAYPNYYQIKYRTPTISISKIQTLLQDQELLIQYCLYEKQLFILTVAKTHATIAAVELSKDFLQWITTFQKTIFLSDLEEYISLSLQLYNVLFRPIEQQLKGKEQLLIIPDGALHNLPFDALISPIADKDSIENFSQLPYLLHQFQVQYHYSATLIGQSHFKKQLDLRSKIQDGFLGVAPVKFGKRASSTNGYILKSKGNGKDRAILFKSGANEAEALVDLEATETEVKKVYELFEKQQKDAIALFYDMASKEQLLEYIEDYKHILLSTHGFSDKENTALSGLNLYVEEQGETASSPSLRSKPSNDEKGKLYISDVMNLQLKADLVVLSSCESGIGKLQTGEGMMALHRAFLYAGAQNIVYSLFKVPQDSTSELVQSFFRYALEGENYSTALRKAKLELINDASFEPIDWAGFALIGG